jgi:hypothetical protein
MFQRVQIHNYIHVYISFPSSHHFFDGRKPEAFHWLRKVYTHETMSNWTMLVFVFKREYYSPVHMVTRKVDC